MYFSHHLVTVPPRGWIEAAHTHGCKCLGTFITEFGLGRQRCARLFATREAAQRAAEQLAAVAAHFGFDVSAAAGRRGRGKWASELSVACPSQRAL